MTLSPPRSGRAHCTESSRKYEKNHYKESGLPCTLVSEDLTQRVRGASSPGRKEVGVIPAFQHLLRLAGYTVTMIWSRAFRLRSGTVASLLGYPTGSSTNSFSCEGRPRSTLRRGPQLRGVVVTVTSPAFCSAASRRPQAMAELFWDVALSSCCVAWWYHLPFSPWGSWDPRFPEVLKLLPQVCCHDTLPWTLAPFLYLMI